MTRTPDGVSYRPRGEAERWADTNEQVGVAQTAEVFAGCLNDVECNGEPSQLRPATGTFHGCVPPTERHKTHSTEGENMRKFSCFATAVICAVALEAAPAAAHNAGCVVTGSGAVVTVGSGKDAPLVSPNNPHYHGTNDADFGRLDLIPGRGDQYGARFAADQGNSAVQRPGTCQTG